MSAPEAAMAKVLRIPEMVEHLLLYLDPTSILGLVGLNILSVETLESASQTKNMVYNLIKKVLELDQRKAFEDHRQKVKETSTNLLAQLEDPKPLLLEFLHVILAEGKHLDSLEPPFCSQRDPAILLSCPLHSDHHVTPRVFILLEDCEAAVSSAEQSVKKVLRLWCPYFSGWLAALNSRASRQECPVTSLNIDFAYIFNTRFHAELQHLADLLQNCDQVLKLEKVKISAFNDDDTSLDDWEAFARIFERHPSRRLVFSSKKAMLQARREDLKRIWDALQPGQDGKPSFWSVEVKEIGLPVRIKFTKMGQEDEATWKELEELLDAPEPEEEPMRLRSGRKLGEN